MLNFNKTIEILISLQVIIISTMIPVFVTFPFRERYIEIIEIPITWQVPLIIVISLIFSGDVVFKAFSIYLLLGIFFIPVFHQGGSLGYLLTPNFGYLLGTYPLIKTLDNLNKKNSYISLYKFIKSGIVGISIMHIIGIVYSCIQIFYIKRTDILLYNISNYSLGKYAFHLLMLTPITILLKPINSMRYSK